MNLPIETPSQGDIGNAGAVVLGGTGAASAQTFTVGAVGFGPTWSDYEEGLREMYDAACRTIVRMECEADELRAEIAMLQEQALILTGERDEARIQYRSTEALGIALVKTIGEMKAERVDDRLKLADWRDCARRLEAAVEYYHPDLRDETEGGWSEERAAIALFDELECQHQVKRDEACRESCRDKAAADGGWGNI